jgi:glycosyltransferase involved in cell wall biosynthesis
VKLAYFVRPHLGGTFSVFDQLRRGLAGYGIDVRWIGVGDARNDAEAVAESAQPYGFYATSTGGMGRDDAAKLIDAIEREQFDGVFVNVLAEHMQMNIARYLPPDLLRVMIVHSITPATYAAAASIRDNVHATVGVSERCRRDLVSRFAFPHDRTLAIPNAVDIRAFSSVKRTAGCSAHLRLLYLGRIEDASKGVMWLPRIFESLPSNFSLTLAGDGPDLPRLKARLSVHSDRVTILGAVRPGDVPDLLARHDALVMPSRYEGFGITLIEAMAAGCTPVVSRIAGVTDSIVRHDVTGLLFPIGDWREAARHIRRLGERPDRLASMSVAARAAARKGFGIDTMAKSYARLLADLQRSPPPIAVPLPLDQWTLPAGFRPGLRTYLPQPVKNWLRMASERFHQQEMVD